MSADIHLKNSDRILATIGDCRTDRSACVPSGPGPDAGEEDLAAVREYVDQFRGALDELGMLEVDIFSVDARDLESLADRKNADLLTRLIDLDPAYRLLKRRRAAIEPGASRLAPFGHSPGVPEGHYRRLVYLVQAGLAQLVDPNLVPDGSFDAETREAVVEFQATRGIDVSRPGLVDARTVDALLCELRYDAAGIKARLGQAQAPFIDGTIEPFYINGGDDEDGETRAFVREALVDAMIWVGALGRYVDVSTPAGKGELQSAIESYLCKDVDIIGKMTIGEILVEIDLANPAIERR
ncbi:MAG: peptidoglycan-binding protein [Proteobacteria bacterium]|nr:peptidoglycan-binding protein [Pseudomonadota bacterium]